MMSEDESYRSDHYCTQVKNDRYSTILYKGIDEEAGFSVTIYIRVTALPTYLDIKIPMKKFLPCKGYWTTFRPDPTTWTTLRPDPTTWTTFRPDLTTTNNKVKPHNKIKQTPYGIIVGTVMGVLLLLVLVICLAWHRSRKQKQYMITYSARETGCVYISYFPDTEKATHSVLNLAARLKKHTLSVKVDVLCQREIDDIGKPVWYQSQLEAASKIILVISKGYLKVYEEWRTRYPSKEYTNNSINSRRNEIFFELGFISTDIFSGTHAGKLLVVLADVKESELPCFFKGRSTYPWPKCINEEVKLVHALCGTEEFIVD